MPTLDELQNALIKADAAGNTADAKVFADAIRSMQATAPTPASAPQSENSGLRNFAYGATKGLADLVQAPAQLALNAAGSAAGAIAPNSDTAKYLQQKSSDFNTYLANQEKQYQQETPGSVAAGIGRFAGNAIPFMASGGTSAASNLPKALELAKVLGKGATASMLTQTANEPDENYWAQKAQQGALGAAGAGVGKVVGNMLGRVISPNAAPEVKAALAEGITPTPGTLAGKLGSYLEAKSTSLPIAGDVIRGAQSRVVEDFNRAAYARALNPIGESAKKIPVGNEGVLAVQNKLSDAYNKVLDKVTFKGDQQLGDELQSMVQATNSGAIPASMGQQFRSILKDKVLDRMGPNGTMDGQQYKAVEKELLYKIKQYRSSMEPDQQELGRNLSGVLDSLKAALVRSNPKEAPQLSKLNTGWANYAIIREAASKTGTEGGVFSPAQLGQAIRAQDKSVGKGNFATGQALMQDLYNTGKQVVPTYPDSGTAGRLLTGAGIGAAIANPTMIMPTIAGGALAAAPYTQIGNKLLANLLVNRPAGAQGVADVVKNVLPLSGAIAAPGLIPFYNQGP